MLLFDDQPLAYLTHACATLRSEIAAAIDASKATSRKWQDVSSTMLVSLPKYKIKQIIDTPVDHLHEAQSAELALTVAEVQLLNAARDFERVTCKTQTFPKNALAPSSSP